MAQSPRRGLDLRDVIKQIYRWTSSDQRDLAVKLKEMRRETYRKAMAREARRLGCPKAAARARPPSGASLRQLDRLCKKDAASIGETWNRDVGAQVDRLYAENPRGNRYFYYSRMEKWARKRTEWKRLQIGLFTHSTALTLAQQDFIQNNGFRRAVKFRFIGPPPVGPVCRDLMAMGLVDQSVVDANPCPIHINCPHTWQTVPTGELEVDCRTLWVG